ncbi:MAG: aromatic amino acid transport family protein [Patescibacteria group bacterium]
MNKNYFKAVFILMGTILGAGMFAVPFMIEKSGIIPLLVYVAVLAAIQFLLHRIYAEIILSTPQRHRMPGYAGIYLGSKWKKTALLISIIGKHGALLAYIILGGIFLHGLLAEFLGGSLFLYTFLLFLIEAFVIFFGLKLIARVELWLGALLILVVLFLGGKSLNYFELGNFALINWNYAFLPYGVVFFAVGGQAAIPEICRLLKNQKKKISSAIAWGTFLAAFLVAGFAFLVVGTCGGATTPDALVGIQAIFGNGLAKFSLLIGLLATVTSYIVICQSLREVYWWDAGMNNSLAWLLACLTPFLLYLVGLNDLTGVIGLTGSITGGLFGMILIVILFKSKQRRKIKPVIENKIGLFAGVALSCLFIVGAGMEIWRFFQ